ncbi:MAG: DUF5615 family PIN-like protein [Candidatus Binataceae bacterium]
MRLLLDEQLPRHLARELTGHDVRTVRQQGWTGAKNGELLRWAVAAAFEVFITADKSIPFQQNLAQRALAIVILVAPSNAIEDLLRSFPICLRQSPRSDPVKSCALPPDSNPPRERS